MDKANGIHPSPIGQGLGTSNAGPFGLAPGMECFPGGGSGAVSSATMVPPNLLPSGGGAPVPPSNTLLTTVALDYTKDFPCLPEGSAKPTNPLGSGGGGKAQGQWAKPLPKVKSSQVTQVFHLPAEERRNKDFESGHQFGEKSQEQMQCNEIATLTGSTIELCESRDHCLTIVVTGKRGGVEEARKRIVAGLQTQANREIRIPREHHRVLIGRDGRRLQELQAETDCRIVIPGKESTSDLIRISGPREGIEKAVHQIQLISDEQSKLAQEHLIIPRIFYPWIRGPYNETLTEIQGDLEGQKVRINIPPPSASSEVIVVTGEKEGVYKAAAIIKNIFEEKQRTVKAVTCKVATAQHRYIIGPQRSGLAEILKETGVSVEVPPEESGSDTVTLRGDPEKLGHALTLVYAKASSIITAEIECPQWLHRFIIGQGGSNIRQIIGEQPKVSVNFEDSGVIYLEGAPEEVRAAHEAFSQLSTKLQLEMANEVIRVSPGYHRHIIGKSGGHISKIKQETGVLIHIPDESAMSDEIRIEGKREGVAQAKDEILQIVKRLENEKTRDILIEQRIHKLIIGVKGETIRDIRERYPGMIITFPEPGRKSDIIQLRGPREEVDRCYKDLQDLAKKLMIENFQVVVPIFKDFHKNIIGKGGHTIRKIRDATSTKIDLPSEQSSEDTITITGRKENVEKAVAELTHLQNELASIVVLEAQIPHKLHPRLIGNGGRLLADISEQCGGCQIKFPPEKQNSDKVTVRGPKDDAEKALKLLMDLAKDREASSFQDTVNAKPELFRFLIGRGGTKIKKVREGHPNVRILFPRQNDNDQETIHLIGRKEDVASVKKQLEELIVELNTVSEIRMEVPMKWHRHFVARGAAVLREVQTEFGDVMISFPKQNTNSSTVTIKGGKDLVEGARKRIQEIVDDLEAQVTVSVPVPFEHHGKMLSNRGAKIQEICSKHNVQIKFPNREEHPPRMQGQMNGVDGGSRDVVLISGLSGSCEAAKQDLLAQVPIQEVIDVPFEFHGTLIGRSGKGIRDLQSAFEVSIVIPEQRLHSNQITVAGPPQNVHDAVRAIKEKVEEFERQARDRELKNFELVVRIPPEYHAKIVGPKGVAIGKIRTKHEVQIEMPGGREGRQGNRFQQQQQRRQEEDEIIIRGYEENATKCKEELERMVSDWEGQFTMDISLDSRIHNRLIGQKGKNIRKIMDDYKVEIKLPRNGDPDPNLVRISGKDEEQVYDCVDHLRNMEEEYLQDMTEDYNYRYIRTEEPAVRSTTEVSFTNAPWSQAPDTSNIDEFPAMGAPINGTANGPIVPPVVAPAWGRRH